MPLGLSPNSRQLKLPRQTKRTNWTVKKKLNRQRPKPGPCHDASRFGPPLPVRDQYHLRTAPISHWLQYEQFTSRRHTFRVAAAWGDEPWKPALSARHLPAHSSLALFSSAGQIAVRHMSNAPPWRPRTAGKTIDAVPAPEIIQILILPAIPLPLGGFCPPIAFSRDLAEQFPVDLFFWFETVCDIFPLFPSLLDGQIACSRFRNNISQRRIFDLVFRGIFVQIITP